MRIVLRVVPILIGVLVLGCGGGDGSSAEAEALDPAEAAAGAEAGEAGPAAGGSSSTGGEGRVEFRVDGEPQAFDWVVADETFNMGAGAALVVKPDASATEAFRVTFLSIDLRDHEYPGELPPEEAGTSIQTAMMQVGFSYTDAEGQEWAGPARIHVESFDGGILVATFDDVTLPHTDDALPAITVGEGSVRVRMD